jgi:molybdopterin-guanine dinucleotide biosynthesis protein A
MMSYRISGVILAGGDNKRFGGITKANVVFGGVTIVSRIVSVMEDLFSEIIIVTSKHEEFREYNNHKIVTDEYLKAGPLGGIHAALKSSSEDAIFVIAGDMPFPDKKIINEQITEFSKGEHDIIIPMIDQLIEPLHAIYSKTILTDLEKFLSVRQNRAVRDFFKEVNVGYLRISDTDKSRKAFTNINSASDLANINL